VRVRARPLYGSAKMTEAAARLGVNGVLENRVQAEIDAGRLAPSPHPGTFLVSLGRQIVVELATTQARLDPKRKAWMIVSVRRVFAPRPTRRYRPIEVDR
jgi:hypothetical protein